MEVTTQSRPWNVNCGGKETVGFTDSQHFLEAVKSNSFTFFFIYTIRMYTHFHFSILY